ncbi:hypothetical protein D1007_56825 [Hordeum vulgare]|nr:hypothetical protein D1007_56825 [Hordeum vulgare]
MRYGDMTSNLVQCFNFVLKGGRQLPVTTIAEYTFYKLNEYFLKHSEEIDKLIGESEKPPNEIYPKKVVEWQEFQKEKSAMQRATCFDNAEMKYQVDAPGGTTRDGQSYGGRSFTVSLRTRHCTCERPSKYHWTCSHMITACRMRNFPFFDGVVVRLHEFNLQTHKLTWASRFHPFLDPSQWPEYHGPNIRPDPGMMVQPKGRRRTKRYRNDMDDLMSTREFGSGHFMEPRDRNQCGDCNETTHSKRTCKTNKTSKGHNASTSDVGGRGGSSVGGEGDSSGGLAVGRGSDGGRRGRSSGGLVVGRGSGSGKHGGSSGGLAVGRGSGGGRRGRSSARGSAGRIGGFMGRGMASSQPNKATMKWVEDTEGGGEMPGWWDKAVKKVKEEETVGLAKKKQEEYEAKQKEEWLMFQCGRDMEKALQKKIKMAEEKRMKDFRENTAKLWAGHAAKKERDHKRFIEKVVHEASLIRKREEEQEEEEGKETWPLLYTVELHRCHHVVHFIVHL